MSTYMDGIHITPETVTPVIEQVVAEMGGDYIYDQRDKHGGCFYRRYENRRDAEGNPLPDEFNLSKPLDAPGCIVGHVLHQLGVPLDELTVHEGSGVDVVLSELRGEVIASDPDPAVVRALSAAQEVQDKGATWGAALAEYHAQLTDH